MTSARSLYNRASAVGPLSLRFVDGLWYVFEVIVLAHFFVLSQVLNSSTIMSDAAAAPAAAPAKAPKKRTGGAAKAKKHADHPKYSDMIKAAVTALKVCNLFLTFCLGAKCLFHSHGLSWTKTKLYSTTCHYSGRKGSIFVQNWGTEE